VNAIIIYYLPSVSRNNRRIYTHILHLTYLLDLPNLLLPYHAQTQPVRPKSYQSILLSLSTLSPLPHYILPPSFPPCYPPTAYQHTTYSYIYIYIPSVQQCLSQQSHAKPTSGAVIPGDRLSGCKLSHKHVLLRLLFRSLGRSRERAWKFKRSRVVLSLARAGGKRIELMNNSREVVCGWLLLLCKGRDFCGCSDWKQECTQARLRRHIKITHHPLHSHNSQISLSHSSIPFHLHYPSYPLASPNSIYTSRGYANVVPSKTKNPNPKPKPFRMQEENLTSGIDPDEA
jgi:hypothetical protein